MCVDTSSRYHANSNGENEIVDFELRVNKVQQFIEYSDTGFSQKTKIQISNLINTLIIYSFISAFASVCVTFNRVVFSPCPVLGFTVHHIPIIPLK